MQNNFYDIKIIEKDSPHYPAELLTIDKPPNQLYVRGSIPPFPCIAFVGARKCTSYGKGVIDTLLTPLAHHGFTLVSGLALGIDGFAHERALALGMPTIAVLGTGVNDENIYPKEHFSLAQRILHSGGAIISEYPEGTGSRKEHFPQRNRIISGLSIATIVIEAGIDSGSLITARLALDQHREVLAVPGPIWSATSKGCHQLIKSGAQLCDSAEDIIQALKLDRPKIMEQTRKEMPLTPTEQLVYRALDQPVDIDALAQLTNMNPSSLLSSLSLLELKGYIKQERGQYLRTVERVSK